jgi:hypothetical protein
VPLRVYDESISVLRRALDTARLGQSEKTQGMARLDAFTRSIEQRVQPDADVEAAIAHEREMSPRLGGRTVFDDRSRTARRDKPHTGQLDLFPRRPGGNHR